jgi:hypothetical protein
MPTNNQGFSGRPRSLLEVESCARAHGSAAPFLREFLDEFYTQQDPHEQEAMLAVEPPLGNDDKLNAWFAAVAEHLALRYRFQIPAWTQTPSRFLHRAYFPIGLESLKATYLVESPVAFRRRMIFVEADPLSRPRRAEMPGESAPEYLFAMKCMAMRSEVDVASDKSDIMALADETGIEDAHAALEIVASFYPSSHIPAKVRFGVEEIMEEVKQRRSASRKKPQNS